MAKCRIGHFVEAQVLEAIEIDYIDESEVLSPADDVYHIDKTQLQCSVRLRRKGSRRGASPYQRRCFHDPNQRRAGNRRCCAGGPPYAHDEQRDRAASASMREDELFEAAKTLQVPYELVQYVHENGKLPVVNFAAGGVATPADAALMMQLGAEGVFVGSGIFKSGNPEKRANAIVKAVTNYTDAKMIAELSEDLGEAMVGINESEIQLLMAERGK